MVELMKWLDRRFEANLPVGLFPVVVERLRGTPARVEEKIRLVPVEWLTRRSGDRWSIQEHAGHLLDLEELWTGRLKELIAGENRLRAADLTNRATYEANHNEAVTEELTAEFRRRREAFVGRLESLDEQQVVRSALHPRLKQPMRTIDLCHFVAEHDDHHLSIMTGIWKAFQGQGSR